MTKKLPWRVAHTKHTTQIVGSKLFRLVGGTPSFTSRGFYKFCHVLSNPTINSISKTLYEVEMDQHLFIF